MTIRLRILAMLAVLGLLGAAAFVYFGVYNVAATEQHTPVVYHVLHYAMERSVKQRTKDIEAPDLADRARIERGFSLYRQHCAQCHGAPGVAPDALAFGLRPEPVNLTGAARKWEPPEIYWVIKYGIKMSGMTAWNTRLSEEEMWDVTAFVKQLPTIAPEQYMAWDRAAPPVPSRVHAASTDSPGTGQHGAQRGEIVASLQTAARSPSPSSSPDQQSPQDPLSATSQKGAVLGNAEAGKHAMQQYLCVSCHSIPGVTGADQQVGPPLAGIARRRYIGGVIENTPENMMRWLRDPQAIDPKSGMPSLGIKEQDLRDMVAYLYTLKDPGE